MSLDRWFGKDVTNITPPGSEASEDLVKCTRPIIKRVPAKRQSGPRVVMPLKVQQKSAGALITSVCTLNNHSVSFFGLHGSVLVANHEKTFGTIDLGKYPVRSMCAAGEQLVTCSEHSIELVDITTSKIKSRFVPDNAFGFCEVKQNGNNLVVASKNGSAYLCDLRTEKTCKVVYDAHDLQRRPKRGINRGPALTAISWVGDGFATGSVQDQTVKFWDMRKSGVRNEVTLTGSKGGICSLASDDEHKLWALGKSGTLQSFMVEYGDPIDTVQLPRLPNYQADLCVFELFGQPLLAVGGDKLVVCNRPKLASAFSYQNKMQHIEKSTAMSKICWNEASQSLVGTGDGLMNFWR